MKNLASGPKNAVSAMPLLCRYASAFSATPRGSRSYGSRVIGSTMVQMRLRVGSALKTSIQAVAGSGMTSMSLALMARHPRMLEPSKPSPSVKISSLYSVRVVVKCCQEPGRSVNLKSTSFTSWSLIILLTSDGVLSLSLAMVKDSGFGFQWSGERSRRCSHSERSRGSPLREFPGDTTGSFDFAQDDRVIWSHRFFADLFRANAHGVLDWEHKNFSVADLAGLGRSHHDAHGFVDHLIGEDDFDFHFREKIDGVFAAAINFGVAFLAAEAFHFRHGHALNAELGQVFLHSFEFERLAY